MGLEHIAPILEADARAAVLAETWGHLAPKRNTTYQGRVVFAFGIYDNGDLNPTVLAADFEDLDGSPWFYDCLHRDLLDRFTPGQGGTVWETFRAMLGGRWSKGKLRKLLDVDAAGPARRGRR